MHPVIETTLRPILFASLFLLSVDGIAAANNLEAQEKALRVISDFADSLCTKIPLTGSADNAELSVKGKAELSEFLKKFANSGVEGAAKYQNSEWQGMLQRDLADQLTDSRNCKLRVFDELHKKLLDPVDSPPTKKPEPPIEPRPASQIEELDSSNNKIDLYTSVGEFDKAKASLMGLGSWKTLLTLPPGVFGTASAGRFCHLLDRGDPRDLGGLEVVPLTYYLRGGGGDFFSLIVYRTKARIHKIGGFVSSDTAEQLKNFNGQPIAIEMYTVHQQGVEQFAGVPINYVARADYTELAGPRGIISLVLKAL